jgi:RNA polymerase sigma factor (TIGR02999 family)
MPVAPHEATEKLIGEMYGELREIAGRLLRHERDGHTLQKTALVHETFIRLFENHSQAALSAKNFLALAAHQMRQVLVDYGRKHRAGKRSGKLIRIPLFDADRGIEQRNITLQALNEAMETLEKVDPRAHSVVELKFFGGYTTRETAEILEISQGIVDQDWQYARAWLFRILSGNDRPA